MKYLIYLAMILLASTSFAQMGNQQSTDGFRSLRKRAKRPTTSTASKPIAVTSSSSSSKSCTSEDQTSLPLAEIDNLVLEEPGLKFSHDPNSGIIKNEQVPWVGNCSDMISFELVKPSGDLPNLIFAKVTSPSGCKNHDVNGVDILKCKYEYIDVDDKTGKSKREKGWFEPNHAGFIDCLKTSGAYNSDATPNEAKIAVSDLKIKLKNATDTGAVWFASKGPLIENNGALYKKKDFVKDCIHFESVIPNEDGEDIDFNIYSRKDSIHNMNKMKAAALCESGSHNLISKNLSNFKEMGSLHKILQEVNVKSLEDKIKKLSKFVKDNYKEGTEEYKNLLGAVDHKKLRDLQDKLEIQYAKLENDNLSDDEKDDIEKVIKKLKKKIKNEDKLQISDIEDFSEYVIEPLLVDIKELYEESTDASLTEDERKLKKAELAEKLAKLKNYRKSPFLTDKDLQRLFGKGPLDDEEFFEGVISLNNYRNTIKAYESLGNTVDGVVRTRIVADLMVKNKNKGFYKRLKDKRFRYRVRNGDEKPSIRFLSKARKWNRKVKGFEEDLFNLPRSMQLKINECFRIHQASVQQQECRSHYQNAWKIADEKLRSKLEHAKGKEAHFNELANSFKADEAYAAKHAAKDDESDDEEYDSNDYAKDDSSDDDSNDNENNYAFKFKQNPRGNMYGYNNQQRQPTINSFYNNGQGMYNNGSFFNNQNRYSANNYGNFQSPWANRNNGSGLYFGLGNSTGNYNFRGNQTGWNQFGNNQFGGGINFNLRGPSSFGNQGFTGAMPYQMNNNGFSGSQQFQFPYNNGVRY